MSNRPLIEVILNDLTDVNNTKSNRDSTEVDERLSKLIQICIISAAAYAMYS